MTEENKEIKKEDKKIGVGIGVLIMRDNKILLGKRNDDPEKAKSALNGAGTWTMPGGKLKFGETFEQAALREVKEETGFSVEVLNPTRPDYINYSHLPDKQYIIIVSASALIEGSQIDACEDIPQQWFQYPEEFENLKDEDCLPRLKEITRTIVSQHFPNLV